MAREVVTKCDKCGQPGEDVDTYTIRLPEGSTLELDLDLEHAKPLLDLAELGRPVQTGGVRRQDGNHSQLEGRIRGLP